ncbi:glycerophosphoryl diester phosphodiesterase [Desulfobotulus alkaliphilus]|uniref:Glycerophosphoryl diester phosphodiesterase n=1 Tax=Desulfobotulus alkaliphilus TaxID=622671 RepID=A0A562R6D0_9BACT|nr:glycerophosphodiester phosphodiesterase family protein [Desulfobotulus alkaliphilus]TWI63936.1 glycerophosphoryl diester phosphodiesterase [Desulfobotulus alkaliphilus]
MKGLLQGMSFFITAAVLMTGCMGSREAVGTKALQDTAKTGRGEIFSSRAGVPYKAVIAHRGASYYAPESTEQAYILARQMGAEYLEIDLQRTRDGVLIASHCNDLSQKSNILDVFPGRAKNRMSDFTLAELKSLDAGSWFNDRFPGRARSSFVNAKISTLEEVINIAEGKLANGQPDPNDNGNRPGLYIETKVATFFPGIEKDLYELLKKRGWLATSVKKAPAGFDPAKNVGVQFTTGRTILQTFEPESLPLLNKYMPETPKCFLLWLYTKQEAMDWGSEKVDQFAPDANLAKTYGPLRKDEPLNQAEGETYAQFSAKWEILSEENYRMWLKWAKDNGALAVGPGTRLAGYNDPEKGDQSYMDLIDPWFNETAHDMGMLVHAYTLDETVDMARANASGVDGMFTNRPDVLLRFYGKTLHAGLEEIFTAYGW